MLPDGFSTHLDIVKADGANRFVSMQTPDLVHTTGEILAETQRVLGTVDFTIIREDGTQSFNWDRREFSQFQPRHSAQALSSIEASGDRPGVVLLWSFERLVEDRAGDASVRNWVLQARLFPTFGSKLIVALDAVGARLPAILSPYFADSSVGYPLLPEIRALVNAILEDADPTFDGGTRQRVARALLGLELSRAEDLLTATLRRHADDADAVVGEIIAHKQQTLVETLGMRFLNPSPSRPHGMEHLLDDFEMFRSSMCVESKDRQRGWLLVGEPGVGKTMVAEYIAHALGHPAVTFDVSAIMDSLLGETEKRTRRFIKVLESSAPAVLFIDEFEKSLSGTGERDGGTMKRTGGLLLEFLSGTSAPVFVVAAANATPENPAMIRRGRFDRKYFVGRPSKAAREAILSPVLQDHLDPDEIHQLASLAQRFTGADLTGLAREARFLQRGGHTTDPMGWLRDAIKRETPRVEAEWALHERLRAWGSQFLAAGLPETD